MAHLRWTTSSSPPSTALRFCALRAGSTRETSPSRPSTAPRAARRTCIRERRRAWCGHRQRQAAHRRARAPVRREGLLLLRKGDDVDLLAQPVKLAILLLVQFLDRALRGPVRRLRWRGSVCRVGVRCPGPSERTGARGADRRASGEVEGVEGGRGRGHRACIRKKSRSSISSCSRVGREYSSTKLYEMATY